MQLFEIGQNRRTGAVARDVIKAYHAVSFILIQLLYHYIE